MNESILKGVLARLYTAAGRNVGQAEELVWREAVGEIPDDVALEAAREMVRESTGWHNPPTPAEFRQVARELVSRRDDQRALPEGSGRVTPTDEAREHLVRLRKLLAEKPIVKRVP